MSKKGKYEREGRISAANKLSPGGTVLECDRE